MDTCITPCQPPASKSTPLAVKMTTAAAVEKGLLSLASCEYVAVLRATVVVENDTIRAQKDTWARRPGEEGKFTCSTAQELASSLVTSALVLPPQPNWIVGVSMLR